MTQCECLEIASDLASILTAVIAVVAYGLYRYDRYQKRTRLEAYLKEQKDAARDKGQRTLTHLIANLGMIEGDILDGAFRSRHVRRTVKVEGGEATGIFLEYKG